MVYITSQRKDIQMSKWLCIFFRIVIHNYYSCRMIKTFNV